MTAYDAAGTGAAVPAIRRKKILEIGKKSRRQWRGLGRNSLGGVPVGLSRGADMISRVVILQGRES
jgi:hypothetical protein